MNKDLRRSAIGFVSTALLALTACTGAPPLGSEGTGTPITQTSSATSTTSATGVSTTSSSGSRSSSPTRSSAPATADVEVAGELTISGDQVTWVDSTLDTSNQQSLRVVPLPGAAPRTARLSPDATFLTPGTGTPRISADGLGAAPTSRADFLALSPGGWFAPKLSFDADGDISRIATRYRP